MNVESIMSTNIVTVNMDDKIRTVREMFEKHKIHHILVMDDDNELIGLVSDRDVLRQISPFISTGAERAQDLKTLDKKVHQIMSRQPITIQKETTVRQAAEIIIDEAISCLPVLSNERALIGVVTWRDILKNLVSSQDS